VPSCPSSPPSCLSFSVLLGLRLIRGLRADHAQRIIDARNRHGRFQSIASLHRLAAVPVSTLRRLAEADAFASMGLSRRQALWEVMALHDDAMPLFDCVDTESNHSSDGEKDRQNDRENPPVDLPVMPLRQEVAMDYSQTGLSLKQHPVALVRDQLRKMKIATSADLQKTPNGRWLRVAGLVLVRQRPGTASGIVFETLEDETGIVNLIIRPNVYDRYRPAARTAGLLCCDGQVQREGKVIHIIAARLTDLSYLLGEYRLTSRDFH
jgi:error-prone DNA polymerase